MDRPEVVAILLFEPWQTLGKLLGRRPERDAVVEVGASVDEREQLALQQVGAAKGAEDERLTLEERFDPLTPSSGQHVAELHWPVVQPVVDDVVATLPLLPGKGASSQRDGLWQRRDEHINVAGEPGHHAHEHERRAANHDTLEAQAKSSKVAVEGLDGGARQHGGIGVTDTVYGGSGHWSRRGRRRWGGRRGPARLLGGVGGGFTSGAGVC